MTINPGLFPNLAYDPLRDFVPIGLAARAPLVLVVPPSLPVKNLAPPASRCAPWCRPGRRGGAS